MEKNDRNKIVDKIKKLLKLHSSAESLGNVGEAYAAATAVHRLLTTYNLSLSDISDDSDFEIKIDKSEYISYKSPYGVQWKRSLLSEIAEYNYCTVLITPGRQKMAIVGQEDNVEVVKVLYDYLVDAFTKLSKRRIAEYSSKIYEYDKRLTESGKKNFLKSYFIGAVYGLENNFKKRQVTSEETGLMVCHTEAIDNYLKKDDNYSGDSFSGRKPKALMPDAVIYGQIDGENINLNRQIERVNG